MGGATHWGSIGNCGTVGDQGIYLPPPEHGCTIHCDLSYHILVHGGRAEAGNAPILAYVIEDRFGYPGDKSGACFS